MSEISSQEKLRIDYSLEKSMVLFLAQKHTYKGVKALLEATRLVWSHFSDTVFAFIGPRTEFSEKLFPLYKDERILELGKVDLQTKTDALAACNILCVPSEQESFGGVYTEAWSFGKPVIGCDIPAVSEVIDDQENGLLTSQKPEMIADHIIQLLNDESLARRMGSSGKRKVDENFTWKKIADRTLQAYYYALSGK